MCGADDEAVCPINAIGGGVGGAMLESGGDMDSEVGVVGYVVGGGGDWDRDRGS